MLEGYYDADKHIVCLHLQSLYDSVVLADLCRIAENDVSSNVCIVAALCSNVRRLMIFLIEELFLVLF